MAKASDNLYPYVHLVPAVAPSSPAAGAERLYLDSADSNKLKRKNSSGTVTAIEGSGGGSGITAVPSARFTGPNSGTDITTSSTAYVDLTGYTVSIAAAVGDVLEISFSGTIYSSATENHEYGVAYNGTMAGPQYRTRPVAASTVLAFAFTVQRVVISGDLSSGSVPVKIQWRRNGSGSAILFGDSSGLVGQLAVKNLLH